MYKDVVTIFNREKTALGDIWHPHVLRGVNLNTDKGAIYREYGPESQDNAVLNVRYEKNGNHVMVGAVEWMPPKEWSASNRTGLTFASGDIFYMGEWTGGTPYDDNYAEGFLQYMLNHFDFVYTVTSVGYFTVIPHFEVTGR